jgi:hypothetical protein
VEWAEQIRQLWGRRQDRYSEERSQETVEQPKFEMHFIGG